MSIEDEMHVYDNAEVSYSTGETESYDAAFFPNVIRRRELELIKPVLQAKKPKLILDYGCGGGWLSLLLLRWGFDVVGMDVSKNMVKSAKLVCHKADFIVCDAMRLPFKDEVFDFIIGIAILHHLNLKHAFNELKRISLARSVFLFMEPNSLNPLSAFGRKFFQMEAHTKGEKQFTPEYLKTALNLANFNVERYFALFFLAFPVARFSKIARMTPPSSLVKMTYQFENVMEKMPVMRGFNSNIVAIGTIHR
jgi:SAM-dependent methyltransferase